MMGGMLAGTKEAPGEKVFLNGRRWKYYRGMGSLSAMKESKASRERYRQEENKLTPEGIEGMVPYKGDLEAVVSQYMGGLRAGMGYVGVDNLNSLRSMSEFHRITHAGITESHPHDIRVTSENHSS
jgi:IMP dehydrogenase